MNRILSITLISLCFTVACGDDDSGGGSGGSSGTGTGATGGGGTGGSAGSGTGGSAGSSTGGSAGSSTGGAAGGGTGGSTNATCAEAETKIKSAAAAKGCTDNSAEIKAGCEVLYSTNKCIAEWEAVFGCAKAADDSTWTCNSSDKPEPPCPSEVAAFETCTGG